MTDAKTWSRARHFVLPWDRPPMLANDKGTSGNRYAVAKQRRTVRTQAVVLLTEARKKGGFRFTDGFRCGVLLTWYPGDNQPRDADGMAPTLKPVLDALVDARWLPDDNAGVVRWAVTRIVLRRDDPSGAQVPRLIVSVLPEEAFPVPHFSDTGEPGLPVASTPMTRV